MTAMCTLDSPELVASVRDIEKTFGARAAAVRALSGVDLEVLRGEVLLLTGPSGSGKTTLLSIIGCILRPSRGHVRICGRDVEKLSSRQLGLIRLHHIGFVFQDFNLLPTLTAVENVEIPLSLSGARRNDARPEAARLMASMGLNGKENRFPADLSGGEKQRVAIARALINKPDLVLADEPTASLDSTAGKDILSMLRESAQRNCGVLIVSHDPRARAFADRVVYLEDGRIVPNAASVSAHDQVAGHPQPNRQLHPGL